MFILGENFQLESNPKIILMASLKIIINLTNHINFTLFNIEIIFNFA